MNEYCAYCGKKLELTNEVSYCNECMRLGYHLPQELTSNTIEDTKRCQDNIYQARLNKALIKFEKISPYNFVYTINKLLDLQYTVIKKEFNVISFDTELAGYEFIVISLETVESLLNDLSDTKWSHLKNTVRNTVTCTTRVNELNVTVSQCGIGINQLKWLSRSNMIRSTNLN